NEPRCARPLGTPAPVVARLQSARALLGAKRVDFLLRRPATVRVTLRDQLVGDFLVARKALHLEERAFVPIDAQPLHALEDRVDRFGGRALEVGVFDAQDELSGVAPRVGPGEERGARAADMQEAGRARCEARTDAHGGERILSGCPSLPRSRKIRTSWPGWLAQR